MVFCAACARRRVFEISPGQLCSLRVEPFTIRIRDADLGSFWRFSAASILARAEFLRRLDQLGRQAGVRLPKGASAQVEAVARALVKQRGPDILNTVAKTHFKTTQRVI